MFLGGRALSRQRWRAAGSIQRLANVISVDVGGKSNASSEPQEKWQPRAKRRREQEFKPANASDLRSRKIIALRRWRRCYTHTHTHTHTHTSTHKSDSPFDSPLHAREFLAAIKRSLPLTRDDDDPFSFPSSFSFPTMLGSCDVSFFFSFVFSN